MDIREHLDRGEKLLWEGVPAQGLQLHASDIVAIPFSLVWGGGVLFAFLGVALGITSEPATSHPPAPFPVYLIAFLFVPIALYITVGRFIFDAVRRARTSYGVTDTRALILSGFFGPTLKSMPLTLGLQIEVSGTDRGSIKFGPDRSFWSNRNSNFGIPSHPFMFERIRNVREVYQLVRDVQQGRR